MELREISDMICKPRILQHIRKFSRMC